jgi:carboxyl-terminal processing protease
MANQASGLPQDVSAIKGKARLCLLTGILLAGLALGATAGLEPAIAGQSSLTCSVIDRIEQVFLTQHIRYSELSDVVQAQAIDQFIKHLDGAKLYLLKDDVAAIKASFKAAFGSQGKDGLSKEKSSKCDALAGAQKIFLARLKERADFAKKTLESKSWKFDSKTELVLDPDAREYPKTPAEADKFQAKYLQFQVSNYVATGMKLPEAREHVVKNYERSIKRMKEQKSEDLYAGYLDSFGRGLDPHSSFFPPDNYEDFEIQMGLSLEGIGATLSSQDGFTVVEQLIEGGSAKSSGLIQAQDKIVAVGQVKTNGETGEMENVFDKDLRDVVRLIRGPKGSKVRLMLLRKGGEGKERLTVTLTRDKIKLEEDAAQISYVDRELSGEKRKIAILNLPSFYADSRRGGRSSASDMKKLLKEAKEKGAEGLVLDLSSNGGGSLDDAVRIAGLFFKTGNVVKQSSRESAGGEATLADTDSAVDWDGPLAVLTSRVSASASEIVAGTMKDYQRAVIVGADHTFGKGTVQSVVPLPPGIGAVKVTVGMFYTPSGYSTQHRGVEADVVLPGALSTDEIGEKSLDYSLPPSKIASFISSDAFVPPGSSGSWQKVDAEAIKQLRAKSEPRVAASSEFQKIAVEAKKGKEKGKVIKLNEALKETKEKKDEQEQKKSLSKDAKVQEYLKRPEIQEAANVVADLIVYERGAKGEKQAQSKTR